jgi:hypothetical protein
MMKKRRKMPFEFKAAGREKIISIMPENTIF